MAYRIAKEKINAIAVEYIANGFNPVDALVKGGRYDRKYAQNFHKKIWTNMDLLAEIDRLQAKTELKADITRESCVKGLCDILESTQSSQRDKISAYSLIADLCGFKRENAPNKEREANLRKVKAIEGKKALVYHDFIEARKADLSKVDPQDVVGGEAESGRNQKPLKTA